MTKKKTSGNPKKPRETGTWYRTLLEGHAKSEFYKHFMAKIRDISTEYFGSKETTRVLKALETSKIQIPSIEIFLFDSSDINDQSLQLYNTCKSIEEFVTKSIINFKKRAETGETEIEIKEFFFVLTDLFQTNELCSELFLKDLLKSFVISLITVRNKSPYVFTIIEPKWAKKVGEQLNLKTKAVLNENLKRVTYVNG